VRPAVSNVTGRRARLAIFIRLKPPRAGRFAMLRGMTHTRRRFLGSLAGASTIAGVAQRSGFAQPSPNASGIEHIVVVTMENRSFDHFLGWLPGAEGKQAGLSYTDSNGAAHATYSLGSDYTGCGHPDPDHSYNESRVAYDGGAMDGFLRAGNNDIFAIGYYPEGTLPFYTALARSFLVCDRYFASILGPTFPNRMFLWAAQTDRLGDTLPLSSLPTIFDRLSAAGVSHRYYFNNLPFLAFWGLKYLFSTGTFLEFLSAAAAGRLPAVSFVDPNFTLLDDGTGNDDHPHADVRNGDAFLARIFQAVAHGPAWKSSVLVITFDEWGGFYEHVAPPRVVAPNSVDTDLVNGQALLGFRVPVIIASPFTRNTGSSPLVSHTVFDHTSILKLIEWRWGLQPLTSRDASSQIGNPAAEMNFGSPNTDVSGITTPGPVTAAPCFGGTIFDAVTAHQRVVAGPGDWTGGDRSPWAGLAQSDVVRQWLAHPRFRQ
jgi:phospholipase C